MIMKRKLHVLIIAMVCMITTQLNAQIPDYGVWPSGVVFTDLDGGTHDIDAILDSGRPVIIDAFAVWCVPCWNYHQGHQLENLHQQYGPGGTNELVVLAVESDASTPAGNITGGGQSIGNWRNGITYPMINDDNLAGIINQAYYPIIIMISPDRSVKEVGRKSASVLYGYASQAAGVATNSNDPRLLESSSDKFFCEGSPAKIGVILQNYGTENLTSADFEVYIGNETTPAITYTWGGNLATYSYESVLLGEVTLTATSVIKIKIVSENDDTSNDEFTTGMNKAKKLVVDGNSKEITFDFTTDNYASEVAFALGEGGFPLGYNWIDLYLGLRNGSIPSIGFAPFDTFNDGVTSNQKVWNVANEGCHYAVFFDYYGDGYNFSTPQANVKIEGANNSKITVSGAFDEMTYTVFNVEFTETLGLDKEEFLSNITLYPNPASSMLNLELGTALEGDVEVMIHSTAGQVVANEIFTTGLTHSIDVSNFEAGMYLVTVKTKDGQQTKRISVVH